MAWSVRSSIATCSSASKTWLHRRSKGTAASLACQSNETCSSLTAWVTLSSSKPPAARSASGTAGCPACTPPSCSAPSQKARRREGRHRRRRGRAGHRRLRHAVRRAVQQHHPGGLADRGPARARRRHHGRLPVRQRPAGQPPDRRPDRRRRHRRRHRLRHRGDEPRRPGRQRRAGPLDHPRPRRGTSTCPTSSPPPSGSPSGAASPARTSTSSASTRSARPSRPGPRAASTARSRPIEAPVLDENKQPDRRARTGHPRPGPARHHAGGPGRAEAGDGGRHPHRGHVVADLRRRRRGAVDGRRQGQGARASSRGPASSARRSSAPSPTTTSTARCSRPRRCWRRPA